MATKTELLFASSKYQLRAIKKIHRINQQTGIPTLVIALNEQVKGRLHAANITCKTLMDCPTRNDLRKETISWVNEWATKKAGSKSFRERLVYQDVSLWGFIHPYLYPAFEEAFALINKTLLIIETENPRRIYINTTVLDPGFATISLEKVIIGVAASRGIETVYLRSSLNIPFPLRQLSYLTKSGFIKFMHRSWASGRKLISKIIIFLALKFKPMRDSFTKSILFLSYEINWRGVYDYVTDSYKMEDVYMHPIIKELKKKGLNYRPLAIDTYYGEKESSWQNPVLGVIFAELPNMIKKLAQRAFRDELVTWKSFYGYETKEVRRKVKQASRLFKQKWAEETNDEDLKQSLSYKGVSLWPLIHHHLNTWIPLWVEEIMGFMETAKAMIMAENPAAIVLVYETGPYGKASVVAANSAEVPTVALQHGIIHPRHPDYMHDDVTTDPKRNPLAIPIPTKTAVYGDYTREVLTKIGSYPPTSVVVTGQPRYDLLIKGNQTFDKRRICEALEMEYDKKTLLLITSTYSHEREKLKQAVVSAVKAARDLDAVQLVIKPHPSESVRLIQKTLEEHDAKNVKLISGYLNELLYICDVVINQGSTVGLEAMIVGKPVININYTGLPDQMPLVESGAAVGVYWEEKLPKAIKSIFKNSKIREKMKTARERFVYEQVYKTDGKATERVADLILKMAEPQGLRRQNPN